MRVTLISRCGLLVTPEVFVSGYGVGRDAIQRMADAVAVGADPMSFVTPPRAEIVRR